MKYLPLPPQEELLRVFDYDEDSGWLVWKIRPSYNTPVGSRAGRALPTGYKVVSYKCQSYYQHRIRFKMINGYDPLEEIDHRDPTDTGANNPDNLRGATSSQNKCNRRGFAKSGYKGVVRLKNGRFMALFTYQGKQTYLGTYDTGEEANEQYRIMAELFHGEFANAEHRNVK